eukprot:scaffold2727_cov275-Chaetoceros_neogracile.AAC.21
MRKKVTTIPEIATTFTGMFYLGYIPSFWVRIRTLGSSREPTRIAPLLAPFLEALGQKASALPSWLPKVVHLPITSGAIFIFWTWCSIAFSDVGAYFAGRKFGKTKLGKIAPAAGAASPNKTVEGYIGGSIFAACFATAGAYVMRWPHWYVTGPVHGILLAFLGLVGDLTASVLKRDSGMKDFGDLLPEHGGIMDRHSRQSSGWPFHELWSRCIYLSETAMRDVLCKMDESMEQIVFATHAPELCVKVEAERSTSTKLSINLLFLPCDASQNIFKWLSMVE